MPRAVPATKPCLLIVDDDEQVRRFLDMSLSKAGFANLQAQTLAEARHLLVSHRIEGLLLDLQLPDGNGLDWIKEVRETQPGTAIIVITGAGDIPLAVEAMRRGADQFLTKPFNVGELEIFLRKSLEVGGLRRHSYAQKRLAKPVEPLFGDAEESRRMLELASLAAENDSAVLLQGETGCGKGVLARWIHDRSSRGSMPFVELSCASLRGELLSSELFGHARGAFTSAVADRQGLLDVADGGTLFLDEIGELDPSVQARFLTVLEEKRYRRLGEVRERRSEFRLICATNRDLGDQVRSGQFRPDLHFRVNVFPIQVPSLRERREEIPALVTHLLNSLGAAPVRVHPEAMALLQRHSWPGNVRELKYALERALLLSRRSDLEEEHLSWLSSASPVERSSS